MNDQRNLTMGIQFETDRPASQLSGLIESIQEIRAGFQEAGQESEEFGSQAARSAGTAARELEAMEEAGRQAADSMGALADSGGHVEETYRQMGTRAGNFKEAVIETSARAMAETNSLSKTIRAGFQGAYGFAEKKVKDFGAKVKAGAAKTKDAVLHPVRTIRESLSAALERAREDLSDTGTEADRAASRLEDMGRDGEEAGGRIRDGIGSAIKSFFAISAGIELVKAGIEAVKGFAGAIVNAGVEAERTGARFEAMFEADSGVKEWADNFSSAIHRSSTEVQGFLTSNKKMYQELGLTGQAADDLSRITTSLAYDFGSAFHIDDSEALETIQDYISGNTAALSEYGIQIDDLSLKQSAMAMGLGDNIEALDEAAMAQVRMNTLLEKSGTIQQAAAKKQEGYANGIKSLKGIWSDFLSSAGERFAPVFTGLTDTILTAWPQVEPALMGIVDLLGNGLAAGIPIITELASSAIPPLIQTLGELFEAVSPIGGAVLDLAMTALPPLASAVMPLIETFGTLAQSVLPPFARIAGNLATAVVPPLASALKILSEKVIVPLIPPVETIANALLPALSAGLEMIPPVLEILSPILTGIADVLSKVVGFLGKIAGWAAGGLGSLLDKAANFLGAGTTAKSAGAQIPRGSIPHNADGDDNFKGGWTHINERGGELAFIPSGSAIIPADKSQQIIDGSRPRNNTVISAPFSPVIYITISGDADPAKQNLLSRQVKEEVREWYQEWKQQEDVDMAIQQGNT